MDIKQRWEVVVDVETTYRTTVLAVSEEEAEALAIEEAYEDTHSCESAYSGETVYTCEKVGWVDLTDGELIDRIREITGVGDDHINHLMTHIMKAELAYQRLKEEGKV